MITVCSCFTNCTQTFIPIWLLGTSLLSTLNRFEAIQGGKLSVFKPREINRIWCISTQSVPFMDSIDSTIEFVIHNFLWVAPHIDTVYNNVCIYLYALCACSCSIFNFSFFQEFSKIYHWRNVFSEIQWVSFHPQNIRNCISV